MEGGNTRSKYFYYFRGNLSSHVQFFYSWAECVRENGIPMELITFLSFKTYIKQKKLVEKYKSPTFHIYVDDPFSIISTMYFFICCVLYKKTVVHLKKRSSILFKKLKYIFPNKLNYIIEGEGDPISEYDYLIAHPYKKDFYNKILMELLQEGENQSEEFSNADFLTFGYTEMRDLLNLRYPELNLNKKIILSPMSFRKGSLYFCKELRDQKRQSLGLDNKIVMLYMGNAFYSWQNVFRSIEIFQLIKNKINYNLYLILLIRKQDFDIVNEFLVQLGVNKNEYLLTNVDFSEVNAYLNAADFGISLRHKHIMNETTPSAKILEYLGSGLTVITTTAMGGVSDIVIENKFGIVLENMDDDCELLEKLKPYLKVSEKRRKEISLWANNHLSTDTNMDEYIKSIRNIVK